MKKRTDRPGAAHRSSGHVPLELTDAKRGQRLQKVLADRGVASRRRCEEMIEQGLVTVNGERVDGLPAWVNPDSDRIEVAGRSIPGRAKRGGATKIYVVVNKPRRVICTNQDPQGRKRIVDLVELPHRLYPVGRLDADSTGLILLTNDGELANRLTHPRYEVPKEYEVSVHGRLSPDDLERLKSGLYLARRSAAGGASDAARTKKASVAKVRMLRGATAAGRTGHSRLVVTLREGQNRQIRRLLARLGHKVRRLQRTAIGPIRLKGLRSGCWRMLTTVERQRLMKAAGLGGGGSRPGGRATRIAESHA